MADLAAKVDAIKARETTTVSRGEWPFPFRRWGHRDDGSHPLNDALPPCADECMAVFREAWAKACRINGADVEIHLTHVPPLVPPLYPGSTMRCPHGVVWYSQPTSEQIAKWAEAGVE